ncbi:MAG: DUF362 domain-containing protein [Candidatus Moraniibacteriota bacterium]
MSKVYFSKEIEGIINQIDFSVLGQNVAIKVHFGEEGCDTFINPDLVRKVYQKIESLSRDVTLIECNVLYKGSRTNSTDHIETAKHHGFTDMKIDILDGEKGDEFVEIDGCKIGKGIEKYDSLVVISHFKGHMETGFGGAIKNIGMGLASRAGKLAIHAGVHPIVSDKCIGCSICAEHCDVNAIMIDDNKAHIDEKKCIGCAMCIAVCPINAMDIPWEGKSASEVQVGISEYSKAILEKFPKPIFINVLQNITKLCDCMDVRQEPIMEDVGIVYSDDIVAVEKASLDLVNEKSAGEFRKINGIDHDNQLKVAEEFGLGNQGYELVEI